MNVRNSLILFICLASAHFFKLIFLPRAMTVAMLLASSLLVSVGVIILSIYDKKKGFVLNFQIVVGFFIIAYFLSIIGAKIGHNQPILLTAMRENFMLLYFLYFFLHYLRIKPDELEKILLIVAILFIVVFLLQYFAYPKLIVGGRVESDRGTIRIFIPGMSFGKLIFFYCLYSYFKTRKYFYLLFCLIFLSIPILQGTRNQIAIIFFVTLSFLLINKQVKSKAMIIIVVAMCGFLMFIIFQDIFMALLEHSDDQASKDEDGIRVRSIRFFLTEFSPHKLNYIIGNGLPHGASSYGLKEVYYQVAFGYFLSDIGIIGVYAVFGVIFIVGVIFTLIRIFNIKIEPSRIYIKYWAVIVLLDLPLGGPFNRPDNIVVLVIALYLLDVSNYNLKFNIKNQKKIISNH